MNDLFAALREETEIQDPERAAKTRAAILEEYTLRTAVVAFREETTTADPDRDAETRDRVTNPPVLPRRNLVVSLLLPMVAVIAFVVLRRPDPPVAIAPAPEKPIPIAPAASTTQAIVPEPSSAPAPPVIIKAPPPPKPQPSTTVEPPVAVIDPEETLYRQAHEAHFVAKDSSKALSAWTAYLASYPTGRFAPEAHYNKALTLIRLDRTDEAKTELKPFADGKFNNYRQQEAKTLLDAMP